MEERKNSKLIWAVIGAIILITVHSGGWAVEEDLVKAAWAGNKEVIIDLLSKSNTNVNAKNKDGTTALMAVSQNGNTDLVKLLLEEYRADPNIKNNYGRTALMLADYESTKTMELLLSHGADVNAKNKSTGSTTLMLVAGTHDNYPEVIKLLIRCGADVNAKDSEGKTAIDYAQERLNSKISGSDKREIIKILQNAAHEN